MVLFTTMNNSLGQVSIVYVLNVDFSPVLNKLIVELGVVEDFGDTSIFKNGSEWFE